ncbi:MAG: lectin MOA-related protein [Deltaproteobacteria bacterium]|nr:lectin MOA-related protein [Deltaproteobacteria bacterium]
MAKKIVGMGINGATEECYVWYDDQTVSSGTFDRLSRHRFGDSYTLPKGKHPKDIVDIAIAGSSGHCFAWYRDGTVSSGTVSDLDRFKKPLKYTLPQGKTPADIVGMALADSDDQCFAWYRDGTVSSGTVNDLEKHTQTRRYCLPKGKTPVDIVGMDWDESNGHIYVWFGDGDVCQGTISDLDKYEKPRKYETKQLFSHLEIQEILIETLGEKICIDCTYMFADAQYYATPEKDVQKLLKKSKSDKEKYILEIHDCDDFALSLKHDFIKDAYKNGKRRHPHALGIMWANALREGAHAINVVITDNQEVKFIEPQNDRMFAPRKEDGQIYFFYF